MYLRFFGAGRRRLRAYIATVLAVILLSAAASGEAGARPDVVADPNLVVERLNGPVTVVIIANPFRFPWTAKIGHQTLTGPSPASQLAQGLPTQPTPAPAASEDPVTIGGLPGATPTTAPGTIGVSILPNPGGISAATPTCDAKRFDALERCIRDLETQAEYTKKYDIQLGYESVCAAQLEFVALQARTDILLAGLYFDSEINRKRSAGRIMALLGDTRGGIPIATCNKDEIQRRNLFNLRATAATVLSARAAIDRVRAFPTDAVANELKQADAVGTAVAKFAGKDVDAETIQDLKLYFRCTSRTRKNPNCKNIKPARLRGGDFRIAEAKGRLAAITSTLKPFAADQSFPKAYAAAAAQLQFIRLNILSNVGVSRFFVKVEERCQGLYGAESKTTITVQRADNESNSIVVDCPSRAFASFGFAFEYLPQQTLGAVAANGALPQPPPGGATIATETIQPTTRSDVRAVPVVMFNVLVARAEHNDSGLYGSFGVGLQSINNSGFSISDYLVGLSWSFTRNIIATLGLALGQQQQELPGYHINDPLNGQVTPITQTRNRLAGFFAVTYGAH